jgi:protein CpxP
MLHKTIVIIPALLLIGFGALMIGCHHKFHHKHIHIWKKKGAERMIKKLSRKLDLTEEQEAKVEEIHKEIKAKHQGLKGGHAGMFQSILDQVKSDEVNKETLNKMFDEKKVHIEEMRSFMIEKFTEFHGMLTPEQRKKLVDIMVEHHHSCCH